MTHYFVSPLPNPFYRGRISSILNLIVALYSSPTKEINQEVKLVLPASYKAVVPILQSPPLLVWTLLEDGSAAPQWWLEGQILTNNA